MKAPRGFLLIEALIAILILAVAVAVFLGVMAQILHLSKKSCEVSRAIWDYEKLLFEMESGDRLDLIEKDGRAGKKFLDRDVLLLEATIEG